MKIWVRAVCRPLKRPSTQAELADAASSTGQHRAQRVADRDRPVGAAHPDVDVVAEGVVAPGHVLEALLDAPVVRRVDDALLLPGAPGMGAGRAQREVHVGREREQPRAPLALPVLRRRRSRRPCRSGSRSPRRSAPPRPNRTARRPASAAASTRSNAFVSSSVRGSSSANSSSSPTVKSCEDSNDLLRGVGVEAPWGASGRH